MKFQHFDLGRLSRGEVVEVSLAGSAANVRLMDSSNFTNYRNNRNNRYIGGLARQSPVRLQVPYSGHWHVTVDLMGLRGEVRSGVRVLPNPLPTIHDVPLSSIPGLIQNQASQGTNQVGQQYDVFISHASEDKDAIVRPLANALKAQGLTVWYDEFELRIGDSLRRKIDQGLANSRVGLVVISRSFFAKGWTNYELDGIVTRAVTGEQILLPIWHDVTKQDVVTFSPSLADKVARTTSTYTVEEMAAEIAELLRSPS